MFPDVPDRLPTTVCVRCRLPIQHAHAIVEVLTAAGVGPGSGGGTTVHINEFVEAAHLDCAKPTAPFPGPLQQRTRLKPGDPAPVPALAPDYQCVRCGKVYERGARFVQVYRAEGIAQDPMTKTPGLRCTDGFETAHVDCADPTLVGNRNLILVAGT